MEEIKKEIVLNIKKEDYDNSSRYTSCDGCLIATAVKRQFNVTNVIEGVNYISIEGVIWSHPSFTSSDHEEKFIHKNEFSIVLSCTIQE